MGQPLPLENNAEASRNVSAIRPVARQESLSTKVYQEFRRALMTGAYEPGEKVTIRAIAEAAKVSYSPAREAVSRLILEGALENAGPKTVIVPNLSIQSLDEITAIRKALECMATDIGAPAITSQELEKLARIQERLEQAMDAQRYQEVLKHNEEFHFLIYRKCGYPHAIQMIEACWVRVGPSLNLLYPEFSISKEGVNNHHAILDALGRGKPEQASRHINADIEAGYASLSALLNP